MPKFESSTVNKIFWNSKDIVELYSSTGELATAIQPAEETILKLLNSRLPSMKMLDIGVGTGRTTRYFASTVGSYIGIDISEAMIAECNEKFGSPSEGISFYVCDATSMDIFQDNEFDLILFSFNGIDYLSHSERLQVLSEVSRIGKPGSFFCFSTHNITYAKWMIGLHHRFTWRPRTMFTRFREWFNLCFVHNNPLQLLKLYNSSFLIFNDGAFDYRNLTYYISPAQQVEQLKTSFENIRLFRLDGKEGAALESIDDWWIYYICNVK